jgi:hypothetical protein
MSIIAIGMNGFLAALLLAALAMGWRLDKRLRGVRESQNQFARAIKDLDTSTARAQSGLADLRAATDEAIDLLGGRIVRAKEAADRLDRSIAQAEATPVRRAEPAPVTDPVIEPKRPEPRGERPERMDRVERYERMLRAPTMRPLDLREPVTTAEKPLPLRGAPTDLHGLLELAETGRLNGLRPLRAPVPPAPRPAAPAMRRPIDDDLFDDIGAMR